MADNEIVRTQEVLVREMELGAGAATAWHYHSEVRDYFVGLSGTVRVETREPQAHLILEPGHRFQVAPGVVHRVVNLAAGASLYLLVQGVGSYDFRKVG